MCAHDSVAAAVESAVKYKPSTSTLVMYTCHTASPELAMSCPRAGSTGPRLFTSLHTQCHTASPDACSHRLDKSRSDKGAAALAQGHRSWPCYWPRLATWPMARASCTVRVPQRPSVTKRPAARYGGSRAPSWLLRFSSPSHHSTHKTHAAHTHNRSRSRPARTHTHVIGWPSPHMPEFVCFVLVQSTHHCTLHITQDPTICAHVNTAHNFAQPACV